MQRLIRLRALHAFLALIMVVSLASGFNVAFAGHATDGDGQRASVDREYALVQLTGDPLATSVRTRPPHGRKIDFDSATVRSHRAQLSALRNDFKRWLRANAPDARVSAEFDISLNAVSVKLNGTSLDVLRTAPMVRSAEFEGLFYPMIDDPDLAIIHAIEAWAQGGGPANAGAGVKVAVVDSGIDEEHPCFDDTGYAPQPQLGDRRFTNNKVIAARVFNNKADNRGYTAEAIDSHGTHVAGTVACNYNTPAAVDGVSIPYGVSGVAPRALLGNYNVFPSTVESARSEDILNALEAAYADGFDVANMSLSGGSSGRQDLLTMAVDNLDAANMVVAVAASNDGPGHYTVGSPGNAARALTAGASTVPHFVGAPVTVGSSTYGAAAGDFATVQSDLTAPLGVVPGSVNGLDTACSALSVNLTGKIALVSRGVCAFSVKIRNAQNAGAVAVLVANNVAGDPTAMATDGTPNQPTVPAYMVSKDAGQALIPQNGQPTTIDSDEAYILTTNVDIMAGFSGQGPTDVDFRVKPDVVAPGVNVLSSIPGDCGALGCWAFFQGTSMATPHLAGSAAVVLGQHPTWSAAQVRSAIVNTADLGVLKDHVTGTNIVQDVNIQGAGRENLLSAVRASVSLDPVSVSFGAVPSGSGQSETTTVTLTNISNNTATWSVAVGAGDPSVAYSVSPSSVSVAPGESATITVSMQANRGGAAGDHQAWLTVSSGGTEIAHAAVYTFIR
jgi:subtilisin family serine protease